MTKSVLEKLRRDGLAVLDEKIPPADMAAFNAYLADKPMWAKHVKHLARGAPAVPGQSQSMSWGMEDVILAPALFDKAISHTLLAGQYFGSPATLYSINAFTTNPIDGPVQNDIQEFHRDPDAPLFVCLFIYCSDVLTVEDGPHQLVQGSHLDDGGLDPKGREIIQVFGEAGTMFLADTRGLHRGLRPKHKPRTLFWSRWTAGGTPDSYVWDGLSPVSAAKLGSRMPTDPELRHAIRLVVAPDDPLVARVG